MSQSSVPEIAGDFVLSGSLTDLRLPRSQTPADEVADDLERQLDHLVDVLAAERTIAHSDGRLARGSEYTPPIADSRDKQTPRSDPATLELSIVMPCLNEAETVGNCVLKALYSLEKLGITGEVIVADNGSHDDSVAIAEELGARVVHVVGRGYGSALMGGIEAARGQFIVMADADDSYDFSQVHRFYKPLTEGAQLVQGCRLPGGGGRVMPGAMSWLHALVNPALTWLAQKMFRVPIHDVYCGMRGFTKELYQRLDQRCLGTEFATEMMIKAALFGAKIEEIPIVLHPDGRRANRPHLRTLRDGWRTLRCYMMFSPRWTFLAPAAALGTLGISGCALACSGLDVAGASFGTHTLLISVVALVLAGQLGWFALLAKTFGASEGLLPVDERVEEFSRCFSLERSLLVCCALIATGASLIVGKLWGWAGNPLGVSSSVEPLATTILGAATIALGLQFAAGGLFLSYLRFSRRRVHALGSVNG